MTNATHKAPQTQKSRMLTERAWVQLVSLVVMVSTLLPYVYGFGLSAGRRFMWLGYNLDDSCTYLSWMRQAADGAVIGNNLFTTDPQHGMALNPLFLALGLFSRLTHLPLIAVYHGSRLVFGVLLLWCVWQLLRELLPPGIGLDRTPYETHSIADGDTAPPSTPPPNNNLRLRKLTFLFVCFSSGLGWLPFWWQDNPINTPIDKWQPEAITFLSLYLSPLFCFSLALQVLIILHLYRADRTGKRGPALWAGLYGFTLGLVHTYDVISLAAVWITYLVIKSVRPIDADDRQTTGRSWVNALIAGAMTLPAVVYIYVQLRTETVFQERAAVHTDSPALAWILTGYGLTLILALIAVYRLTKTDLPVRQEEPDQPVNATLRSIVQPAAIRLLICWPIANLAVAYLPTAIQRKLLQGEHFPIAILAGLAAFWLLGRTRLTAWPLRTVRFLLLLLLSITNIRFMLRDMENYQINLAQTRQHRTYLKPGEIDALHWIDLNVPRTDGVQPLPYIGRDASDPEHVKHGAVDMTVAVFTPSLTNHHVYCGHWGETPDYSGKLKELQDFALPKTTDDQRIALLRKMKVHYLLYSQKEADDEAADRYAPMFRERVELPSYLKRVYQNSDADVYEVMLPAVSNATK